MVINTGAATIDGHPMAPGAATVLVPSLRYLRVERALLQQELADKAGVSMQSVSRGESGWRLRLNIVRRLAEALDVSPAQLMADSPVS